MFSTRSLYLLCMFLQESSSSLVGEMKSLVYLWFASESHLAPGKYRLSSKEFLHFRNFSTEGWKWAGGWRSDGIVLGVSAIIKECRYQIEAAGSYLVTNVNRISKDQYRSGNHFRQVETSLQVRRQVHLEYYCSEEFRGGIWKVIEGAFTCLGHQRSLPPSNSPTLGLYRTMLCGIY